MSECVPWRKKHYVRWKPEIQRFLCLFCGHSWAAPEHINGDGEWTRSPWKLGTGPDVVLPREPGCGASGRL